MDELITWLRAQLDLDERTALATSGGGAHWHDQANVELRTLPADVDGARPPYWLQVAVRGDLPFTIDVRPDFAHIARHDPARVLRDVKAKRALIADHGPGAWVDSSGGRWKDDPDSWDPPWRKCTGHDHVEYPCRTLRLLAAGYDTEPGYQEAWRP